MTCRRSTNEITIILSPGRAAGRRQSLPGRLGICGCQTEEALKFVISEKRVLREVEKMNATEIYLVSILEPALPCGLYPLKRHPIKISIDPSHVHFQSTRSAGAAVCNVGESVKLNHGGILAYRRRRRR